MKTKLNKALKDPEAMCSVCLFKLTTEENNVVTPCLHVFHKNCLEDWKKT